MSIDAHDEFVPPRTFVEYLKQAGDYSDWRYMYNRFTNRIARKWTGIFLVLSVALAISSALATSSLQQIVTGASTSNGSMLLYGLLMHVGFSYLCEKINYHTWASREKAHSVFQPLIEDTITAEFNNKTLGQLEDRADELNHAVVDKGKWKTLEVLHQLLFSMFTGTIQLVAAIGGFIYLSITLQDAWLMFGLCLLIVLHVVTSQYQTFRIVRDTDQIEKEYRAQNRQRYEQHQLIRLVKTCSVEDRERKRLYTWLLDITERDRQFWVGYVFRAVVRSCLISRPISLAGVVYGSYQVFNGAWDVGALLPLIIWSGAVFDGLNTITDSHRTISQAMVSVSHMIRVLNIQPDFDRHAGDELPKNGPIGITLKNVSYRYPAATDDRPSLVDINLDIKPGEHVAIIGKTGSGKSTLMSLLTRDRDPDEGEIMINGRSLKKLRLGSYLSQVGIASQKVEILNGTIGRNLLLRTASKELTSSDTELLAEANAVMEKMAVDFGTNGALTAVGERGLRLSGGQQQRIALARAVAGSPRVLFLDEVTSALDTPTEQAIQKGMQELLAGDETVVVIAHRLSTIKQCDVIVVLEQGRLLHVARTNGSTSAFENALQDSQVVRDLAQGQGLLM